MLAQSDSDSIGYRILVDGELKAERITHEVNAFTFCLLKSHERRTRRQRAHHATIRSADDPSIFGAHCFGVVGDRRHRDIGVPSLEQVEKEHSVSLSPNDALSFKAMNRMGEDFKESNSGSSAMIVLEGQQSLGDDAHQFYDRLIRQLQDDPKQYGTSRISGRSTHGGRCAKR